jgi:hypothetical protein
MTKNELKQLIKEVIKEIDMTDKKCEKCKKGTYGERSQYDDMEGKVTCDKCGNRVNRWKTVTNENILKHSTDPKEVLGNIIEIADDDNMDDFNKVINMRALAKGYFDKVGYKVTNENYEDGIKDAKDRMAYLALRKQEKDYISKSKQSSSPIKKQHYMDMSKQVLDKALAILKKHKVID